MPLIKSKSKKAFSKNVESEMESGKPQPQALAIAFSVKRKAGKKKMAQGGAVNESASSEHRPSPEETDKDSSMVSRNSSQHPPKNDSVTSTPERKQAGMGKIFPLKHPKMVPSTGFSSKLRDQEDHLQSSADVNDGPQVEPPEAYDEEGPNRQGPKVHPLKMMADGGTVDANKGKEMSKGAMQGGSLADMWHGITHPKYADGGEITERSQELDSQEPIHETHPISDEEAIMHHSSMIAAIMAKRRAKMAAGGEIHSHDSIYSDDSSQVDISRNADEDANEEDQSSFNALRKENYNESEGLAQLDSPLDSNQDGREISHDKHDMLAEIRAKMKRRLK